jgi:hypothetical protein
MKLHPTILPTAKASLLILAAGIVAAIIFGISSSDSSAQSLNLKFSYASTAYAPLTYLLRANPPVVAGSSVNISALLWSENPNGSINFPNLSAYQFRWFHAKRLIAEGVGRNSVTINVPPQATQNQEVTLRIMDAKGKTVKLATLSIPLSNPRLLLFSSDQQGGVSNIAQNTFPLKLNDSILIAAQPFFFAITSINDLNFEWSANGAKLAPSVGNTAVIKITAPREAPIGTIFRFEVKASNPLNPQERVNTAFSTRIAE